MKYLTLVPTLVPILVLSTGCPTRGGSSDDDDATAADDDDAEAPWYQGSWSAETDGQYDKGTRGSGQAQVTIDANGRGTGDLYCDFPGDIHCEVFFADLVIGSEGRSEVDCVQTRVFVELRDAGDESPGIEFWTDEVNAETNVSCGARTLIRD